MARRKSQNQSQKQSYSNKSKKPTTDSKSPNSKDSEMGDKTESKDSGEAPTKSSTNNDPEWYMKDPPMVRDAASIYFSYAFGKGYYINGSGKHMKRSGSQYVGLVETPGICVLRTKPTLGFSDSSISPLNVSASSIYAYVRHLNAGRKNYDPADLILYLTAIANLYSAIVWAERLYNFAFSYSNSNRYIGDSLLRAEGVDPYSFRLHLADYRLKLNEFINKVSVFAVPSDITYFNKCAFMYRDVFLENGEGNIRDQIYFYVPDGFYKFALDADNLGMLDYAYWRFGAEISNLAQYTDVINMLEDLISGIFLDEDASLMSGDLFKVYGDRIIRLSSMPEDGVLPLVYDPMVLWQMKNANPRLLQRRGNSEVPVGTSNRTVTQRSEYSLGSGRTQKGRPGCVFQSSDGLLISVERYVDDAAESATAYDINTINAYSIGINKIMTSDLPDPSIGVIMESSRFIIGPHDAPTGYSGSESNPNLGWIDCGSFVVIGCSIGTHQSGVNFAFFKHGTTLLNYTTSGGSKVTIAYAIAEVFMFKYFPLMYAYRLNSGDVDDYYPVSDISNFAIIDASNVDKLHETALLSLLYVPGIARIG
jgi:hypothetical protein